MDSFESHLTPLYIAPYYCVTALVVNCESIVSDCQCSAMCKITKLSIKLIYWMSPCVIGFFQSNT